MCRAQTGTLSGKVLDATDNAPLVGAIVYVLGSTSTGTTTNLQGEFMLECSSGTQTFVCSFIGMISDTLTLEIPAGQETRQTILLKPATLSLDNFEVTAGKFNVTIEEMTVSIEVIKPDIIEDKATRSVETVLDQTPGLNILDGEAQIRGGSGFTFGVGSKVAVVVDDMPLLSGDAGRPEWGFVPIENIDQIEIIKGASSVLSGSSALSGSIHIKTAEPGIVPTTKVNLYSGFHTPPSDKQAQWWSDFAYIEGLTFLHTRKVGGTDIVLGGLVNLDHGYIGAPQPGPFVTDTITNFNDAAMRSEKVRFNFGIKHRDKKTEGLYYGINGNAMLNNTPMVLAWLNDTSGFYRAYPGGVILQEQTIFNLDPFIGYYTANGSQHDLRTRVLYTNNNMTANQSNQTTTWYGDYQFKHSYDWLTGFDVVAGVSGKYSQSVAQLYSGGGSPENNLLNVSGYGQIEKYIGEMLRLSVGLRSEYYNLNDSITDVATIVRAGLNIKLTEGTHVRISYGQGYRFPTIAERYIKTSVGSFGVFDNPDLQPETSWNAEVGFRQLYGSEAFYGYLDVAAFKQEYQNTIEYLFGFWDPTYSFAIAGFKFLNTGDSKVLGIDASWAGFANLGANAQFSFIVGYNYILPTTTQPDLVFAQDYNPGGTGNFSYNSTSLDSTERILKYRFLHSLKADVELNLFHKLSIGGSAKYFSRIENLDRAIADFEQATANTGGSIQEVRYMDYYENRNNGNVVFDARIGFSPNKKHKVNLVCTNVLNRMYSLRPLKAEPVRTLVLQYSLRLG